MKACSRRTASCTRGGGALADGGVLPLAMGGALANGGVLPLAEGGALAGDVFPVGGAPVDGHALVEGGALSDSDLCREGGVFPVGGAPVDVGLLPLADGDALAERPKRRHHPHPRHRTLEICIIAPLAPAPPRAR